MNSNFGWLEDMRNKSSSIIQHIQVNYLEKKNF